MVLSREASRPALTDGPQAMVGRANLAGGEVWFSWSPLIEDVILANRSGSGCDYKLALADLEEPQLVARVVSAIDTDWTLCVGEETVRSQGGADVDLTSCLANKEGVEDHRRIVATSSRSRIEWLVDCAPSFAVMSAELDQGDEAMPVLRMKGRLRAVAPCLISMAVTAAGTTLGEAELRLAQGEWAFNKQTDIQIPVSALDMDALHLPEQLNVTVSSGGRQLAQKSVDVSAIRPAELPAAPQLAKKIKAALSQYRVTGDAASGESALAWTADYAARFGKMPYSIAVLLAPIVNSTAGQREGLNALLLDAFRHLDALNGGTPLEVIFSASRNANAAFIRVMRASLAMFYQHRHWASGLADREIVGNIISELDELACSNDMWSSWCRKVQAFGAFMCESKSISRQPDPGAPLPEGLPTRLANLYAPFASWLEMENETA